MKIDNKYFDKRDFLELSLFVGLAFFAGSKRLIKYFPNTTASGLLLSTSVGSVTAIASKKYAGKKETELMRGCRVIAAFSLSSIILAPTVAKLLKRENIKLERTGAFRLGVLTSVVEGASCFMSERSKKSGTSIDQEIRELGGDTAHLSIELGVVSSRVAAQENTSSLTVSHEQKTALFEKFPELANLPSKDGHLVRYLIGGSLNNGLPILRGTPSLNNEFKASLVIALDGIIREKNLARKKQMFERLCDAFRGCQPEQQRVTSIIAGEVQAFAGSIENYLYEKVYAFLDTVLEQTITHHHASCISTDTFQGPHLQIPHIKSRYLVEFSEAGFFLPNFKVAAHDHVLKGTYGGVPPYNSSGLETFRRILQESFIDFVDQVALELSQEDENISKWLNDLSKTDAQLQGFGWFSDVKKGEGYYEGQKPETDEQSFLMQPYVSRREMLYLFKHYGLLNFG